MRAVVITPGQKGSDRLVEVADPTPNPGEALIRVLSVGVDGTDDELHTAGLVGLACSACAGRRGLRRDLSERSVPVGPMR